MLELTGVQASDSLESTTSNCEFTDILYFISCLITVSLCAFARHKLCAFACFQTLQARPFVTNFVGIIWIAHEDLDSDNRCPCKSDYAASKFTQHDVCWHM